MGKKEVSYWLILLFLAVFLINQAYDYFFFNSIGIFIAFLSGFLCIRLAKKIDKSVNWAFTLGGVLGFFGLLFYWLYYLVIKKKIKN